MIQDETQCVYLLSVSWPIPVEIENGRWVSEPVWDAPVMPVLPQWQFRMSARAPYYAIDWTDAFRTDLNRAGQPTPGEMRGFHVVFRLRVQRGGRLAFYDSDGCIIRRNGEIVHEDREAHPVTRHELHVEYGDHLEVAQWQSGGSWTWGANWEKGRAPAADMLLDAMLTYRDRVQDALANPNGPVLKVYTGGNEPVRCALSIYSMVLNGYRPAGIQIYGEYQWSPRARQVFSTLLPFAEIPDAEQVERAIAAVNPKLVPLARETWGVMKICVGLFVPPYEYCLLDDDFFILDRIDDALRLHQDHTFVYVADADWGSGYRKIWCPADEDAPVLGKINTGLYLMRNTGDLASQSERLLANPRNGAPIWAWEQGFFAWEFGRHKTAMLPTQRYFYPYFDGLPGGLFGYDWSRNPCGFVAVHFGGPKPKPVDDHAGGLVHAILGRHRAAR